MRSKSCSIHVPKSMGDLNLKQWKNKLLRLLQRVKCLLEEQLMNMKIQRQPYMIILAVK